MLAEALELVLSLDLGPVSLPGPTAKLEHQYKRGPLCAC